MKRWNNERKPKACTTFIVQFAFSDSVLIITIAQGPCAHDLICPCPNSLSLIPNFHTSHCPLLSLIGAINFLYMYLWGSPTLGPWMERGQHICHTSSSPSKNLPKMHKLNITLQGWNHWTGIESLYPGEYSQHLPRDGQTRGGGGWRYWSTTAYIVCVLQLLNQIDRPVRVRDPKLVRWA